MIFPSDAPFEEFLPCQTLSREHRLSRLRHFRLRYLDVMAEERKWLFVIEHLDENVRWKFLYFLILTAPGTKKLE